MPDVHIIPSAPIEPAVRSAWVQPELHRLDAIHAENGFNLGADGIISAS